MDVIEKYDFNLIGKSVLEADRYPNHKRKFWKSRFDDEVVRDSQEEFFY